MIKVERETPKYLICYCPHHNDVNTPNLVINKVKIRDKPAGYAHCFSCGWTGKYDENLIEEFADYSEVVRFRNIPNWNQLQIDYEDNYATCLREPPFLIRDCTAMSFGIGWDGAAYTFPMYNSEGNICGIHRRFRNGFKCCVPESELGLFVPECLELNGDIFITEGLSDACFIYEAGFDSIGKPSAAVGNKELIDFLRREHISTSRIIVVGDDFNKPFEKSIGKQAASELAMDLILKGYDATVLSIQQIHNVKDVREYKDKYGRENLIKLLKGI